MKTTSMSKIKCLMNPLIITSHLGLSVPEAHKISSSLKRRRKRNSKEKKLPTSPSCHQNKSRNRRLSKNPQILCSHLAQQTRKLSKKLENMPNHNNSLLRLILRQLTHLFLQGLKVLSTRNAVSFQMGAKFVLMLKIVEMVTHCKKTHSDFHQLKIMLLITMVEREENLHK